MKLSKLSELPRNSRKIVRAFHEMKLSELSELSEFPRNSRTCKSPSFPRIFAHFPSFVNSWVFSESPDFSENFPRNS